MRKVGKEYVRKCYNRFRERYFPERELPDWKDLEFEFVPAGSAGSEWGEVDFEEDSPLQVHSLRLDETLQIWSGTLKYVLLHEMVHMVDKSKSAHGVQFYAEFMRALSLGAIRECF